MHRNPVSGSALGEFDNAPHSFIHLHLPGYNRGLANAHEINEWETQNIFLYRNLANTKVPALTMDRCDICMPNPKLDPP